jgi:hypothetical protein
VKVLLLCIPVAGLLCVWSTGCSNPGFDGNAVKAAAAAQPIQLDSEEVAMSQSQLECGEDDDLWSSPVAGGQRSLARLQQKGRDLGFSDDVSVNEPGFPSPYSQVRGKFTLQVSQVLSIKAGEDSDTKIVEARTGVKIAHSCFANPPEIMGIRKGKYSQDLPATLEFDRDENGWHLARIVH